MSNIDGELAELERRCLAGMTPEREAELLEQKRVEDERDRRSADAERRRRLVAEGIPLRSLLALESSRETDATKAARSFVDDSDKNFLILSGPRGTGKTVAAVWICVERHGTFIDVARLARVNRYSDEEMRPLERCRLLVIDDLGQEFSDVKGSFAATLDGLINARYGAMLQTVITTNLTADDFKARYGERVADRIRECGRFIPVTGESMRRKP